MLLPENLTIKADTDFIFCGNIAAIENLTHRTGNFKKFDIFVSMLKSAILKVR
jgi:hypothetical protein